MKIVVFGPDKRTGVLKEDQVIDIAAAYAKYLGETDGKGQSGDVPSDLGQFIEGGDRTLECAQKTLDYLFGDAADQNGAAGASVIFAAADTQLHAPIAERGRIACAGGNFADHAAAMAARSGGEVQTFEGDARQHIRDTGIWGFWKVLREYVGPGGEVVYPKRCKRLDYEGEMAIVLGKQGKDIPESEIKNYIWGVTLLGDWSARMTVEPGPLKFGLQKNFDGSCSIGPCIVVGEVDPFDAMVETLVNGERRQYFNNGDMVFSFGEYLEHLSRDFTFYPGDMISGGTAAGTAADSAPLDDDGIPINDTFLNPGDTVEIRSPGIGSLSASIVSA